MKQIRLLKALFLLLILVVHSNWAEAHPPGLSSIELAIKNYGIDAKVTFALQDIEAFAPMDSDLDAEVSDSEREAAKPTIAKLLAEQFKVTADGQEVKPASAGTVNYDDQNNAHVEFHYAVNKVHQLTLQSQFLNLLPDGHQEYATVRDNSGKAIFEKMLGKTDSQLQVTLTETEQGQASAKTDLLTAFIDFFKLGIEHILTGYDHLLFLFALLAVTHNFWAAFKIITFFTIAHSITLAFAGLNIFDLPGNIVEPLIAATIVYVAVENLIRGEHPKGRQWLTFGFGLIHGFGFAGVLREMGISTGDTGILLPLLSFNLGIETGQITVAAIILPLIWWLNNKPAIADKFLKSCSLAVCLMGGFWFLERTVL